MALEAGLSVAGTSELLKNSDDPLSEGVFSPSIRGKTSQFISLYKKQ
jgi:predicted methyltransferase